MHAFIGFGSNVGDGPTIIGKALAELDNHEAVQLLNISSLYRTAAWGLPNQADFTNAVAKVETQLNPASLLPVLLDIERRLGRERSDDRWGPRNIDIDLLCCEQFILNEPALQLPHPRMHLRAFVLVPLLEIEPELTIPGLGSARDCLEKLEFQKVVRLD